MTQLVLLGLILLWAVVLVPGWVRSARAGRGNRLAMNVWRRQLSVMAALQIHDKVGRSTILIKLNLKVATVFTLDLKVCSHKRLPKLLLVVEILPCC